jgi:GNAT superfamily N-acetyltransferase
MTWDVHPVRDTSELGEILELQRDNHLSTLSAEQARAQGFVTARHSIDSLQQMHALGRSIVARAEDGRLAGYALMMAREARPFVPILDPMFQTLEGLSWRGTPLAQLSYYVMGQICVAEPFRGQGAFEALYDGHRAEYAGRYQLIVTEIATRNERSLRAHARVGFEPVHRYRDATDEWLIVAWDFTSRG